MSDNESKLEKQPALYPMFLKLNGQAVAVVGAGRIAHRKIESLMSCGAKVKVVAPDAHSQVASWAEAGHIEWIRRSFEADDLKGARIAIAATSDRAVNEQVVEVARSAGLLINAVDMPDLCDFYVPSVLRRTPLQIAVSTAGAAPAMARAIRKDLEKRYPEALAGYVALLGKLRDEIKQRSLAKLPVWATLISEHESMRIWLSGREQLAERMLRSDMEKLIKQD